MGTSFAYVPTLQAIGGEFDMGTILGVEIIGGIVAIIFGIFVKEIRKLFPDVVTGVAAVILMIAGFIPVFSAALTTIPQSVIGGTTLSVFAQIAMTGVRMFTKDGLTVSLVLPL